MSISDKAMLSSVNISIWTARKHDPKVSKEVADNHNAKAGRAGRYNKCLLDVKSPTYQAIYKIGNEVRKYHEEHTLPWAQDGSRILTSAIYFDYIGFMATKKSEFEHAVGEFLRDYPNLKEKAKADLNGLYKEAEYPTADDLEDKFSFDIKIFPVPTANDFRAEIDADEAAVIKERITTAVQDAQQEAIKDLWHRLHGAVTHIVDRLSSPKSVFRDTLIGNVEELCALLPKLNFTGDPHLTALAAEVEANLTNLNPQKLRTDPKARKDAASRAKEISAKMAAYV